MNFIDVSSKVIKIIRSKTKSTKCKYNNIINELSTKDSGGSYYLQYKGESLLQEARKRKVTNCIPHSIELENRLRLVYEVYDGGTFNGSQYDHIIVITDLDNHKWRNKSYVRIFSEL